MIAATNPNYYFKSFRYPDSNFVRDSHWEANHVWNDAIVYVPDRINEGQPVIWDVLPTVLGRMGIAIPVHLDGRNLLSKN